jgi:metallo-beta-lactamase family protein
LIPSFAVDRTQELLADLVALMDEGAVPAAPIVIDSPLATRASEVFARHAGAMEEGRALLAALHSRHVRFTENVQESKALDRMHGFHVVISASGMCEAGRIRFRLKNWLWRHEATVLFVGYQAEGTLGRILLDGAEAVRIQGEPIKVRARIRSLDLYSGHADAPELAAWLEKRLPVRQGVFLVHGEDAGVAGLRTRIARFMPEDRIHAPKVDDAFDLTPAGARALAPPHPRRLAPDRIGRLDWHNDYSKLLLDIHDAVDRAADERARGVLLRRLRRALEEKKA